MTSDYDLCTNCHATVNTRTNDGTWARCPDCSGVCCDSCRDDTCLNCSLPKDDSRGIAKPSLGLPRLTLLA